MPKTVISTSAAPPPLPQFSQAVTYDGLVFCSGAIGIDPTTGTLVTGSVKDRGRRCLLNLRAVLEAAGSSLDNILKVNIYLTDMANFAAFNEAWDEIFTMKDKPVGIYFTYPSASELMRCRRGLVLLFTSCPLAPTSRSRPPPLRHRDPISK